MSSDSYSRAVPDVPRSVDSDNETDSSDDDYATNGDIYPAHIRVPYCPIRHYYCCYSCNAERSEEQHDAEQEADDADVDEYKIYCDYCLEDTRTIIRSSDNGRRWFWDEVIEEWDWHYINNSPFVCVQGRHPVICLEGDNVNDRRFTAYCWECGEYTEACYQARTISYCCLHCRLERDAPEDIIDEDGEARSYWKGWCDHCGEYTFTIKLDPLCDEMACCSACRWNKELCDEPFDDPCDACGVSDTEEIDDCT